ncbi:uncharacterized protein [Halyomorpha halys]|uniref:uncharacterized protein n=1 Tax=Halyomorpha halys TaxID=286706 RepID=UPI0006D4EA76|nr:uncharacterized protein LOC106679228 [Halyomorpha halys]
MSEKVSLENIMPIKKQEDRPILSSEMLYGTYGVWHLGPNRNEAEKRDLMKTNPPEKSDHTAANPFEKSPHHIGPPKSHKMWFFMMPHFMHHMWRHREGKTRGEWHDKRPWKRGMGHHEMNPQKFQEILSRMHKMREDQPKENSLRGVPFPHKFGFCKRMFSAAGKNVGDEEQKNPSLVPKNVNIFYQI